MGLALYNSDRESGTITYRPVIDGHRGGSDEALFYIRNDDVTKWYTNISVALVSTLYDGEGELGFTGISFKFIYGERRPTEAEWDSVESGASLDLPDIGSNSLADTYTYHPFWVRVYIPGNTAADIIDSFEIRVYYYPRVVGA